MIGMDGFFLGRTFFVLWTGLDLILVDFGCKQKVESSWM